MQTHIETIRGIVKELEASRVSDPRVSLKNCSELDCAISHLKSAATGLSYHGVRLQQADAAAAAKPEDRFKHRTNHAPPAAPES